MNSSTNNYDYYGITHARGNNRVTYWLWRKLKCERRNVHLFDEVFTVGDEDGWNHFLSCDACDLMVEIGRVSEEYTKGNDLLNTSPDVDTKDTRRRKNDP